MITELTAVTTVNAQLPYHRPAMKTVVAQLWFSLFPQRIPLAQLNHLQCTWTTQPMGGHSWELIELVCGQNGVYSDCGTISGE